MDVLLSTPQEDGTGHLPDYTIQTIVVVSLLLLHPFIISLAFEKNFPFCSEPNGWMEREREREIFTTCICRLKNDETLGS
jgi:hypothetical protein